MNHLCSKRLKHLNYSFKSAVSVQIICFNSFSIEGKACILPRAVFFHKPGNPWVVLSGSNRKMRNYPFNKTIKCYIPTTENVLLKSGAG